MLVRRDGRILGKSRKTRDDGSPCARVGDERCQSLAGEAKGTNRTFESAAHNVVMGIPVVNPRPPQPDPGHGQRV